MQNAYSRALHRFAVFTACCTFLLLIAGALVTSNDAGLSIPDWPLAYGQVAPHLAGGAYYEFSHRAIAGFVGLLSIALAASVWKLDSRGWVRRLGIAAVLAVIAQAVLGGLTVRLMQPPWVSAAHATLAQLFFCTVVGIAVFTGRWWQSEISPIDDSRAGSVRRLAIWTSAAVFAQLILGAALRHKAFGIIPHLVGAAVVATLIFRLAAVLRRRYSGEATLARARKVLHSLIGLQLILGGAAYWSRLAYRDFPQPMGVMVGLTVAHTVVGALVLASTLIVTLVCYRVLREGREVIPVAAPDAAGAQPLRPSTNAVTSR